MFIKFGQSILATGPVISALPTPIRYLSPLDALFSYDSGPGGAGLDPTCWRKRSRMVEMSVMNGCLEKTLAGHDVAMADGQL
jgi:hypothetical protein